MASKYEAVTVETLTDEQCYALRMEAYQHDDDAMVRTCDIAIGALDGDVDAARERVVDAINDALAQG